MRLVFFELHDAVCVIVVEIILNISFEATREWNREQSLKKQA